MATSNWYQFHFHLPACAFFGDSWFNQQGLQVSVLSMDWIKIQQGTPYGSPNEASGMGNTGGRHQALPLQEIYIIESQG